MTLSSPADLNGDSWRDVVVGAPLEENGQGSIYIFNGRTQDISPTFSQVREKKILKVLIIL